MGDLTGWQALLASNLSGLHPTISLGSGRQQALRYAEMLDVPFVYSANGDGFLEHNRLSQGETAVTELRLDQFPSPDALWQRYKGQTLLIPKQETLLTEDYFYERGGKTLRYYQRVAVQRAIQAITRGQKRRRLVMATGTGKTFTAFPLIWRLRKAGRVQYYDKDGRLVTKSFVKFSRENVRQVYATLADFLTRWGKTVQKTAVLTELIQHGVMLDELEAEVGADYDPFELAVLMAVLPLSVLREQIIPFHRLL